MHSKYFSDVVTINNKTNQFLLCCMLLGVLIHSLFLILKWFFVRLVINLFCFFEAEFNLTVLLVGTYLKSATTEIYMY